MTTYVFFGLNNVSATSGGDTATLSDAFLLVFHTNHSRKVKFLAKRSNMVRVSRVGLVGSGLADIDRVRVAGLSGTQVARKDID